MKLAACLATLLILLSACGTARPPSEPRELVVLVHGMGRTPLSMAPLAVSLRRAGYRVLNVGYDSQGPSVAEIGAAVGVEVEEALGEEPASQVHFVGHSLGTVVIRWLLVNDPPDAVGRAVLLAPPNQGSRQADRFARWAGWALPPIRELRTTGGTAVDLGAPSGVDVAVIAGDRDGKVAVAETCLDGAAHAVVPSGHTVLMMRPRVMRRVRSFLDTGDLVGASDAACVLSARGTG
ncbi:esterase/lipase family protein [Rubrivirga sp.]|uniref:esterase/lipase family protein n=1 Tax=Rubrivirga sp. TaxID=1885344 RepID=UPI003B51FFF2